jgi:hypothetical protein
MPCTMLLYLPLNLKINITYMALSQHKTQMFTHAVMLQCLVRDRLLVMR